MSVVRLEVDEVFVSVDFSIRGFVEMVVRKIIDCLFFEELDVLEFVELEFEVVVFCF